MELLCSTDKWDEISMNERAVLVAKDVIAQVNAGRIVPSVYYFAADCSAHTGDSLQAVMPQAPCKVCGIGAVFAAKVLARNGYMLSSDEVLSSCVSIEDTEIKQFMRDCFSYDALLKIESAYEGYGSAKWESRYDSRRDRMLAIMERIIANGGTFTQEDVNRP